MPFGVTKWGVPATNCVVLPVNAPTTQSSKRPSEVCRAILDLLRSNPCPMKKADVVKHLVGRHDKSAVYRELKKMIELGQVQDAAGILRVSAGIGAKGAN